MDIICPRCGEPWDFDSLHEAYDEINDREIPYEEARANFQQIGCGALEGFTEPTCEERRSLRTLAAQAIYDMSGDDMDGAAGDLEDFEAMGLFDG